MYKNIIISKEFENQSAIDIYDRIIQDFAMEKQGETTKEDVAQKNSAKKSHIKEEI